MTGQAKRKSSGEHLSDPILLRWNNSRRRRQLTPNGESLGLGLWQTKSRQPGGMLEKAEAAAQEALRRRSDFAEAHNNLGNVYHAQGRMEEALASFEPSIDRKPDYADPHLNRALGWPLLGRWAEGWAEYEWRWQLRTVRRRDFQQPLWDGAPLEGRTILLHAEQGPGDTLNFIRYAPLVQARGGRVVAVVPPPLVPSLSSCRGIDHLAAFGEPQPDFDVHSLLLTLPQLFGTAPENVPAEVPYLDVDPQRVQRWRLWLMGYPGFKVGIAWQGDRNAQPVGSGFDGRKPAGRSGRQLSASERTSAQARRGAS
jgi:hypothetical protein